MSETRRTVIQETFYGNRAWSLKAVSAQTGVSDVTGHRI